MAEAHDMFCFNDDKHFPTLDSSEVALGRAILELSSNLFRRVVILTEGLHRVGVQLMNPLCISTCRLSNDQRWTHGFRCSLKSNAKAHHEPPR